MWGRAPRVLGGGGRAPASSRGARGWKGLGGGARSTEPRGERRPPSAPVLGHQHMPAPVRPEAGPLGTVRPPQSHHTLVSGTAAAVDVPAKASAPGAHASSRWRPECRYPHVVGGCALEPRAECSWATPGGAPWRMIGARGPLRGGRGSSLPRKWLPSGEHIQAGLRKRRTYVSRQ